MPNGVIENLFRIVDNRNWDSLPLVFHSNVIYERPGYEPFKGIARVIKFYKEERILAGGSHVIEQIVVDRIHGACWGRFVGIKKDGSQADERFADIYIFDSGKIIFRRSYFYRPAV